MLSGNDFIIFSDIEVAKIYNALSVRNEKATYKELQKLGILDIVDYMRTFLKQDRKD